MDIKNTIARWTWRLETTNRYANLIFRFVWLAMFCKVFNMKPIGYVVTVIVAVIIFVLLSWILDKWKMIDTLQQIIWDKTPQAQELLKKSREGNQND